MRARVNITLITICPILSSAEGSTLVCNYEPQNVEQHSLGLWQLHFNFVTMTPPFPSSMHI